MKKVILLLLGLFAAGIAVLAVPNDEFKKESASTENVYQVNHEAIVPIQAVAISEYALPSVREGDTSVAPVIDSMEIVRPADMRLHQSHYRWQISTFSKNISSRTLPGYSQNRDRPDIC